MIGTQISGSEVIPFSKEKLEHLDELLNQTLPSLNMIPSCFFAKNLNL